MRFKTILTTLAAVVCMAAFSVPAFANTDEYYDDYSDDYEDYSEDYSEEVSVNDDVESYAPLTPSGSLTVIDDVNEITDEDTIENKQFITVQSKNGNTFYIVIDRSGTTGNVYFLNAVDESDLLALIEESSTAKPTTTEVCTCTDKCETGKVKSDCTVCAKDITKCKGTAVTATATPKPEESSQKTSPAASLVLLGIFAVAGIGGAVYWFKVKNKKSSTKGSTDLDDIYEDDDYEVEDLDSEVETEQENEIDAENAENIEIENADATAESEGNE